MSVIVSLNSTYHCEIPHRYATRIRYTDPGIDSGTPAKKPLPELVSIEFQSHHIWLGLTSGKFADPFTAELDEVNICLGKDLSPSRHQAITWMCAEVLSIGFFRNKLQRNFHQNTLNFILRKCVWNVDKNGDCLSGLNKFQSRKPVKVTNHMYIMYATMCPFQYECQHQAVLSLSWRSIYCYNPRTACSYWNGPCFISF